MKKPHFTARHRGVALEQWLEPGHPFARPGLWLRLGPFVGLLAVCFLLVVEDLLLYVPGETPAGPLWSLLGAGALSLLALALAWLAPWQRMSRWTHIYVPLLLLVAVGLLRHYEGGSFSGYSPLAMLPMLWLALYGTRRDLKVGLAVMACVMIWPVMVYGSPMYPAEEYRRIFIMMALTYFVGMTVQDLLGRLRHHAQRLTQDNQELEALRQALIPAQPPVLEAIEIEVSYEPQREGAAGDFYLVSEGPDGSAVIVVGDVMGKGVAAARQANFTRASLATFAPYTKDPARLLELGNRALVTQNGPAERFVSAICVIINKERTRMRYARAGHPPALLLASGMPLEEDTPCFPLGLYEQWSCEAAEVSLRPGSGVLLYTDGLSESRSPRGNGRREMFGERRITMLVQDNKDASPKQLVDSLAQAAHQWAQGALDDDLCIVAVRVRSSPVSTTQPWPHSVISPLHEPRFGLGRQATDADV